MQISYLKLFILVIFSCICIDICAQEITAHTTLPQDTTKTIQKDTLLKLTPVNLDKKEEVIDTVLVKYFYLNDIYKNHIYEDTSIVNIDNYHPGWNPRNPHLHLGNFGSAATPLLYNSSQGLGIDYGYNAYDLYNFTEDSIKIIDTYRAINDLYFSPHQGQENFHVKARFAKTFSDVSFNLNYRRIIQQGFYINQGTKTTNLTTSFHYKNGGRFQTIWSLIVNNNNENHNGGILTTDTENDLFLYSQPLYFVRDRIPTQIDGADSRNAQGAFLINNLYSLRESDNFKLELKHNFKYEKSNVRYSDTDILDQDLFYGQFFKDDRGVRLYQSQTKLKNSLGLFLKKSQLVSFDLGLRHILHTINYGPLSEKINELILYGTAGSKYKRINIKAFAELGSLALTGDINAGGSARYEHRLFKLTGGLRFFRIRTNLKFEKLYLNNELVYNNENILRKPFGTDLKAGITLIPLKLKVNLSQSIENNTTYFDSLGIVQQLDEVLSVTKFMVSNEAAFRFLHFDNSFIFQLQTSEELSLPKYYSQHRLYIMGKTFKGQLQSQIGGEFIFTPGHRARRFLPVIGAFGHTTDQLDAYPKLNAYINFKVNEFKIFFKYEDFLDYGRIRPYYQIQSYPQLDARFRMGVSWLLYN